MITVDPLILKQESISSKMLISLEFAYYKHKRGDAFGLKELPGTKTALINKELIEFTSKYINRELVDTWKITKKGITLMRFLKCYPTV